MNRNRPAALALYGPLREWNTERIRDFSNTFFVEPTYTFPGGQGAGEDDDITGWNTSAATNMTNMFRRCNTFNQPLRFDTRDVRSMQFMFAACAAFNQPLTFDTRNVRNMELMFRGCTAFNQPLTLDTSAATDMYGTFSGCTTFNQPVHFDTHAVTNMGSMFFNCSAFNQPLAFDTRAVLDMRLMFSGCTAFNQPLHTWHHEPSALLDMPMAVLVVVNMFENCRSFNSPVFAMSVNDYNASRLGTTPLGQSAVMEEALIIARSKADPAAQGRIILLASIEAARVLGAPVHDPELAALRERYAYEYRYRPDKDDDMYLPRDNAVHRARDDDDDDDDGRRVRPRYDDE